MPHIFEKPNRIVETAVRMLQDQLILPNTVWLNPFGSDFSGLENDTINIRIELPITADKFALRAQGADRTLNTKTLSEVVVPVKLDRNLYSAVEIQDEEWTLDIETFATKVLARQIRAVAEEVEFDLSNLIQGAPYEKVHLASDAEGLYDAFVDADTSLDDNRIPQGRTLIVGSRIYQALRKDDRFTRADSAGDVYASSALRDAVITRIGGMTIVRCDTINKGAAYVYHPTAFAMVSRAPKKPISNVAHASFGVHGLAGRWVADYSPQDWADVSVFNTYTGYEVVEDPAYDTVFGTKGDGFVRGAYVQLKASSVEILNEGGVTVAPGANHTRQLRARDSFGDDRTLHAEWTSSDPTKATVSNGLVTGVATGSTTITAKVDGNVTDTYSLTVSA